MVEHEVAHLFTKFQQYQTMELEDIMLKMGGGPCNNTLIIRQL